MLRRILGLTACLAATIAMGATANLSFTRPATYSDGSPLPAADIDGYELRCATFNGGACTIPVVPLAGTFTSGVVTVAVPTAGGNACFHVVTQVNGVFSVPSNQSCKVFAPVSPGPPTNVTIAVVIGAPLATAYRYTAAKARRDVAGLIDVGVPCTSEQVFTYRGKQFYRVNKNRVQWEATLTPSVRVAAACRLGTVVEV